MGTPTWRPIASFLERPILERPICSLAPDESAHLFFSLIGKSRRFYITYQKMKEISSIPRKLWPFENMAGHPSHNVLCKQTQIGNIVGLLACCVFRFGLFPPILSLANCERPYFHGNSNFEFSQYKSGMFDFLFFKKLL